MPDIRPPRPPRPPEPRWNDLPRLIIGLDQWVGWEWRWSDKRECWAKVPVTADGGPASSTDAHTWGPFKTIRYAYHALTLDGVGFALRRESLIEGLPMVGIDLDDCLDDRGRILNPVIGQYVRRFDTYCEISPRQRGLRLLALGYLPAQDRRVGPIEIYDAGRYLTLTGRRFGNTPPTINARQAAVDAIHAHVFRDRIARRREARIRQLVRNARSVCEGDARLLERARRARNGDKFVRLFDCGAWQADYPSQSEADLWLLGQLLWWCGGDVGRTDALFRSSALYREKWNRPDYRQRTLSRALEA
jgi:putative DNA primase/helicase